ncbi:TetR/AcrR family transcriptional regulator [Acrocarpospora catenulata]|uniref:TetR/AcrR family transcriptional regulator n=1 Tax=Acrocarpospora catenulata TaxID=2836182 RepID=UPI001BDB0EB1|nr:TetR/AcrR family transcriptional regulator [Acrocarpospora catenulata]
MAVPYEQTGRRQQKSRTRNALLTAARALLAEGADPTVEEVAEAAGISRTTAYRYFPNQRALLHAAHPEIDLTSLLPPDPPSDVRARLDLVMRAFTRLTLEWEPQLRLALRMSLDPSPADPELRQGRAITWIEDALTPLHPQIDTRRLAIAIRSATGIESLIWLTDIAGLTREEATELMCSTAQSLLEAALRSAGETEPVGREAR